MEELRSKEVNEVTELISLAEKVSEQVGSYKALRSKLITLFLTGIFIFIVIILFGFGVDTILDYAVYGKYIIFYYLFLMLFCFVFGFIAFQNYLFLQRAKKETVAEARILRRLLDMIYSLRAGMKNLSVVEQALIDMRLSRIKFSISGLDEIEAGEQNLKAELEVLKATYGNNNNKFQVSRELNNLIRDGKLEFIGDNSIVGDPAPGQTKVWKITYRIGDSIDTREYPEGALIAISGG